MMWLDGWKTHWDKAGPGVRLPRISTMTKHRKQSPLVGDVVKITFWDHAEQSDDALLFDVYGVLTKKTPQAYKIESWRYHDPLDKAGDSNKDNENYFAVVRKAIVDIKVLK